MLKGSKLLIDRDYLIRILAIITGADKLIRDYNDPENRHLVDSDIRMLSALIAAFDDMIKDV